MVKLGEQSDAISRKQKQLEPGLLEINNYDELIDSLVKELPIFRIQKNIFVNKAKLIRGGFTEDKINLFSTDVMRINLESYFTVHSLRNDGRYDKQFEDGFEDCFYEDLLLSQDYFYSFNCSDKKVFCTFNTGNEFTKFLGYILRTERKMYLLELNNLLIHQYGIKYELKVLQSILRFSDLYYNSEIEKVYINRDEFIQEVRGDD